MRHLVIGLVASAFALASAAKAHEVTEGRSVLCDTQGQIERFAKLDAKPEAIQAINADEQNACGFMHVAYIEGAEVGRLTVKGRTMRIVEVLVVAIDRGAGWQGITPMLQYTLFDVPEQTAYLVRGSPS
jgi:hypothetical protein